MSGRRATGGGSRVPSASRLRSRLVRSWWLGLCLAAVAVVVVISTVRPVAARPVEIGKYVEIPYGIDPRHPWPTAGGGPRRQGRLAFAAPQQPPTRQWDARVGVGRSYAPALTHDGRIYVGTSGGVASVEADGSVRWTVRLGLVSGTPSLTPEGFVAVGAQPGEVVIVGDYGRVRSRTRVGGGIDGSPLVLADGSFVVTAYDHAVHRFDAEGRRLFRFAVPTRVRGEPAMIGNTIVAPVGRSLVWLSPEGTAQRTVTLDGDIAVGPAIADDGTAWAMTAEGVLFAVDASGHIRVRLELAVRPGVMGTIAIGRDGAVRVGATDAGIICVGPNGTERWRVTSAGAFPGGLSVDARDVTLGVSREQRLVAVDAAGQVSWNVALGARGDAAPVVGADGTIYVATHGGTLQAWR